MSRYLLKFSKRGGIRFISHLDLLRVFQRTFRRSGLKLSYSNGFNPHAKIGFAMPLSLGFESRGDYMEFETEIDYTPQEAAERLNAHMPPGLKVLMCRKMKETGKTAAAAVLRNAEYTAEYRGEGDIREAVADAIVPFLAQESILSVKYSKKKRKDVETEIRPNIHSLSVIGSEKLILTMMLGAGNSGSLNPQVLMKEFCSFCGLEYEESDWLYTRREMYFADGKNHLKPLYEFGG